MKINASLLLLSIQAHNCACFLQCPLLEVKSRRNGIHPSVISVIPSTPKSDKTGLRATANKQEQELKTQRNEESLTFTPRHLAVNALTVKKNKKKQNNNQQHQDAVTRLESSNSYLSSSRRDKAFARNLVSTTSRRMGQIDSILSKCCRTYPPKGKHGNVVQACLRVGAAQLLFLDVPPYAALKETVDVLKDQQNIPEPVVKFVNAVLRTVDREGRSALEATDVCDNVSDYLRSELRDLYGVENTGKIVNQLLDEEAHRFVDLSWNSGDWEMQQIIDAFEADEDGRFDSIVPLSNGSLRIGKGSSAGPISEWPLYREGAWWVQDVASTLPAIALTKALEKKYKDNRNMSDLHVVDMCAAPGGKTSQLLSAGFQVTAIEANARRSRRLLENLERLRFGEDQCEVVVSPGQEWTPEENDEGLGVSGILVDVPCSATGTGNKRPDVLRKDDDLGNLLETQEILANHCADNVLLSGGIMVYATCSLLARESEDQVQKLLQRGTMKTLPFGKDEIPGFEHAIDENGWLRVLPGVLDGELKQCDGFFVARLEKL